MRYTVVAPMGDYMDAIHVGLKEFDTGTLYIISSENSHDEACRLRSDLEGDSLGVQIIQVQGRTLFELWENTFKSVGKVCALKRNREILVNVGTGDTITRSAAAAAAFVNGINAFAVANGRVTMLPFLKFSYYKQIPDKKMDILRNLERNPISSSLKDLSRNTKMSLPLISYHLNGNLKSEGLREMELVNAKEIGNRLSIELSSLGKMIVGGYVKDY